MLRARAAAAALEEHGAGSAALGDSNVRRLVDRPLPRLQPPQPQGPPALPAPAAGRRGGRPAGHDFSSIDSNSANNIWSRRFRDLAWWKELQKSKARAFWAEGLSLSLPYLAVTATTPEHRRDHRELAMLAARSWLGAPGKARSGILPVDALHECPCCKNSHTPETLEHYLLVCPLFATHRTSLFPPLLPSFPTDVFSPSVQSADMEQLRWYAASLLLGCVDGHPTAFVHVRAREPLAPQEPPAGAPASPAAPARVGFGVCSSALAAASPPPLPHPRGDAGGAAAASPPPASAAASALAASLPAAQQQLWRGSAPQAGPPLSALERARAGEPTSLKEARNLARKRLAAVLQFVASTSRDRSALVRRAEETHASQRARTSPRPQGQGVRRGQLDSDDSPG